MQATFLDMTSAFGSSGAPSVRLHVQANGKQFYVYRPREESHSKLFPGDKFEVDMLAAIAVPIDLQVGAPSLLRTDLSITPQPKAATGRTALTPRRYTASTLAGLQGALIACMAGDTIVLSGDITGPGDLTPPVSGVTITSGDARATLRAPDGKAFFRLAGNSGIPKALTLTNLDFVGAAVFLADHVTLIMRGCTCTAFDKGPEMGYGPGAVGGWGAVLRDSELSGNDFHDSPNGRCVSYFSGINVLFQKNRFRNTFLGIKANNSDILRSKNIDLVGNYFTQQRYHAVELQGTVDGFWFTDNFLERPRLSATFNDNNSSFAFSIIFTAVSSDQHILRNAVICDKPGDAPDKIGLRMAFEVGMHTEVRDNYVRGCGYLFQGYGEAVVVKDNNWSGSTYNNIGWAYGPGSNTAIINNNNADVKLSWDYQRKPIAFDSTVPIPTPTPTPTPTDPTMNAPLVSKTGITDTTARISWDAVAGTTKYNVEIKSSDGNDPWVPLNAKLATDGTISGLNKGWGYKARIVAYGPPNVTSFETKFATTGKSPDGTQPTVPTFAPTAAPTPTPTVQTFDFNGRVTITDGKVTAIAVL